MSKTNGKQYTSLIIVRLRFNKSKKLVLIVRPNEDTLSFFFQLFREVFTSEIVKIVY